MTQKDTFLQIHLNFYNLFNKTTKFCVICYQFLFLFCLIELKISAKTDKIINSADTACEIPSFPSIRYRINSDSLMPSKKSLPVAYQRM